MSSSRTKKPQKARGHAAIPEVDQFRARKEENFLLHDEADLVNFRADALNRFITNQDFLENVVLKLVHTSRLLPPASFPLANTKPGYKHDASDEDLVNFVKELKVGDFFSGDLRLMKAKQTLLQRELDEAIEENTRLSEQALLGEEAQFQSNAVRILTEAHANCADPETLSELETKLDEVLLGYRQQFDKEYVLDGREVAKSAVPLDQLAPNVTVELAPAGYNPRLVMSLVNMKRKPLEGGKDNVTVSENGPDHGTLALKSAHDVGVQEPAENSRFSHPGDYLDSKAPEGFNMMIQNGPQNPRGNSSSAVDDQYMLQINTGEDIPANEDEVVFNEDQQTANPHPDAVAVPLAPGTQNAGAMENDVSMDDLEQFLADPDAGGDMDDMDALMDFDQDPVHSPVMAFDEANSHGAGGMDDDPFSVDFLSQMDNDME